MNEQEEQPSKSEEKSIYFFDSLDALAEDNFVWLASLTPEQHLINAVTHIKSIYADELSKEQPAVKNIVFENV